MASGYVVRRVGQKTLLQCGQFCCVLENHVRATNLPIDCTCIWKQRVRSSQLAAEERMRQQAVPTNLDIQQRRAVLRHVITEQIKKGISGKKRQVR